MNPQELDKLIAKLETEATTNSRELQVVDGLEKLKERAALYRGEDEVISFEEIYDKVTKTEEEFKILSGWPDFDKIVGGFRPQQIVLICALTKSGKTTWSMDLTSRIAEHNPLWIPYEESAEELMRKYHERGLKPPKGYTPKITNQGQVEWLEAKIVEGIAKYNSKIVFIDHLEFLVPPGHDSIDNRYAETMRKLKAIAKKWNICIALMCQLRKPDSIDRLPDYNDIKNSSSPSHHCDTAIVIYRDTKKEKREITITNNTIVSVQLNRRFGGTGNVTMVYENNHFVEKEWREEVLSGQKAENEFANF